MPLERVRGIPSTPAVTIEMAAAVVCGVVFPAFHLQRVRSLRASFGGWPPMDNVLSLPAGIHDRGADDEHREGGALGKTAVAPPLSIARCKGGFGNGKTHGVLEVTSGQDKETNHPGTIASKEARDRDSLRAVRSGRCRRSEGAMPRYEYMCERCKKSFDVVLAGAERAAVKVQCPTCGSGAVTPQMAIFTAKTSRKS